MDLDLESVRIIHEKYYISIYILLFDILCFYSLSLSLFVFNEMHYFYILFFDI